MPSSKNINLKEKYNAIIKENNSFLLTHFSGLSVAKTVELKSQLRKENFQFQVVKNTIFQKAVQDTEDIDIPDEYFKGPIALVYGSGNLAIAMKHLKNNFADSKEVDVYAAFFEGFFFDSQKVSSIEHLPTREQVLSQIMRTLQSPLYSVAHLCQNVVSSLMRAIEEVAKKNNKK